MTYDLDTYTGHRANLASPRLNIGQNRPFVGPAIVDDDQMTPLRVAIADDVAMTRRFLRVVIESCRGYNVVGMAGDGRYAVRMAERLQPDVVLLDMLMPRASGTSVLSGIRQVLAHTKIVIVSGVDPALEPSLLEAGANGFLSKQAAPSNFSFDSRISSIDR